MLDQPSFLLGRLTTSKKHIFLFCFPPHTKQSPGTPLQFCWIGSRKKKRQAGLREKNIFQGVRRLVFCRSPAGANQWFHEVGCYEQARVNRWIFSCCLKVSMDGASLTCCHRAFQTFDCVVCDTMQHIQQFPYNVVFFHVTVVKLANLVPFPLHDMVAELGS